MIPLTFYVREAYKVYDDDHCDCENKKENFSFIEGYWSRSHYVIACHEFPLYITAYDPIQIVGGGCSPGCFDLTSSAGQARRYKTRCEAEPFAIALTDWCSRPRDFTDFEEMVVSRGQLNSKHRGGG
jgi:hypothetical protein